MSLVLVLVLRRRRQQDVSISAFCPGTLSERRAEQREQSTLPYYFTHTPLGTFIFLLSSSFAHACSIRSPWHG